jgi:hypothetical protein
MAGDAVALAGIISGAAVAVVSLVGTAWNADRQRKATERTQRQREAMRVLPPVFVLLEEINPQHWLFTAGPGAEGRAASMQATWKESVRQQLHAIRAGSPSAEERRLAGELGVAIEVALVTSCQYGVSLPGTAGPPLEDAEAEHAKATKLADQLALAIRGG